MTDAVTNDYWHSESNRIQRRLVKILGARLTGQIRDILPALASPEQRVSLYRAALGFWIQHGPGYDYHKHQSELLAACRQAITERSKE